jgi:hypothetical protein
LIACRLKSDQLAARHNLAGHLGLGFLQQLSLAGVALDGLDQFIKGRQDCITGLVIFLYEVRIAGKCKAARRAFGAAKQRPDIRDPLQHLQCVVDGSRVGPRLQVETDRGSADKEEDREANSEDDTLRGH